MKRKLNKRESTVIGFVLARIRLFISIVLILSTLAVYWPVLNSGFVNYDDPEYVTKNTHIHDGPTLRGLVWAFSDTQTANWHPLTWISHMLDCRLYGPNPMGHHLSSLLLHLMSVLFLFLLLDRMTGSVWKSAFVAALFALHPLHVESVAWVAERKDVLSGLLWILTTWAYVRYADRPGAKRYLGVVLLFGLGLMAKPMLVTLPVALLLLDYWPLRRVQWTVDSGQNAASRCSTIDLRSAVLEKIPLLVLAGVFAVTAFVTQQSIGATGSMRWVPLPVRIDNALVAYVGYLAKTVWPANLIVFYPHPVNTLPVWQVVGSAVALACATVAALQYGRRRPYLAMGWLWYLITLVPVIGIVQVGSHAMADRYTYIPLIGVFVIVAWGIPELAARATSSRERAYGVLAAAIVIVLALLGWSTWRQVGYWRSGVSLFERVVAVDPDNALGHLSLGNALRDRKRFDEAIGEYEIALDLKPSNADAHANLGAVLLMLNRIDKAESHLSEAVRLKPRMLEARIDHGVALGAQGRLGAAIAELRQATRIAPHSAEAHDNLALAYYFGGDFRKAWREVDLTRRCGGRPSETLVRRLSEKMPRP